MKRSIFSSVAALAMCAFGVETNAQLVFSEYVEGSGNNKFIEISNVSGASVNLGGYEFRAYHNGAVSPSYTANLSSAQATLADGASIVLYHPSQTAIASPGANFFALSPNVVWFNGDDALEIYDTLSAGSVDIFGRIGEDPGSQWININRTRDRTLRRDCGAAAVASNPSSGFPTLAADWSELAQNTVDDLGTYSCGGVIGPDPCDNTACPIFTQYIEGSGNNKFIEISNPTCDTICLSNFTFYAFHNGASTANYTYPLSNTGQSILLPGASIVLYNASQTLYSSVPANFFATTAVQFNGDDALALQKTGETAYCDIIGSIGQDPGSQWLNDTCFNEADSVIGTRNATITLVAGICTGVTSNAGTANFPTLCDSWNETAQNDTTGLGSHTFTCVICDVACNDSACLIISQVYFGDGNDQLIEIYNPTCDDVCLANIDVILYEEGDATSSVVFDLETYTSTLASGATIVLLNGSETILGAGNRPSNAYTAAGIDLGTTGSAVAVVNTNTGNTCDVFGTPGGTGGWSAGVVTTIDESVTRNSDICTGVTTNPVSGFPTLGTEWTSEDTNLDFGWGAHTSSCTAECGSARLNVAGDDNSVEALAGNSVVAYPNPFANATTIDVTPAESGNVTIEVFNLVGARVATLYNGSAQGGVMIRAQFDATELPAGTYIFRVQAGDDVNMGKLLKK